MIAWWFAPAPAERLAALRIAIGTFALVWLATVVRDLVAVGRLPASHFEPVGVIRMLDEPLPGALVIGIAVATLALLVPFVLGWCYRVVAPLAAAGLLWTLSYRSSWGMVFHTENLLVLHVIALACSPAADAWALGRRGPPAAAGYGWAVKLLAVLTVATYVLAGFAKLRLTGAAWLGGDQLAAHIAVDNLRKALLGGATAPLATVLLGHPGVLAAFAVGTLVIELGAPVALVGGRLAWVWVALAWAFHAGVVLAMNIWFPYPLSGVAFLPLVPAERVLGMWRRLRR